MVSSRLERPPVCVMWKLGERVYQLRCRSRHLTMAVSVERLANQRHYLARDEFSVWLDADCLSVNSALSKS
ncbi:hypothetical protein TNCV_5014981 [Trichonephila clavipes]|nr:hypothetical protein TNCV_5014981 [Trichonephila clavipes]